MSRAPTASWRCAIGVVALCAGASPLAAQPADNAALLKRLDALEAHQRVIEKQLEEIKTLLQTIRSAPPAPSAAPAPVEVLQGVESTFATSAVRGANAAKFVFIEYSDFQCPFCGRYARDVQAPLVQEFVDSGKMKYAFKHFPLNIHPFAPKAAEASECARDQGKFWEMHDQLFLNQQALAETDILRYAQTVGLDRTRFEACLASAATAGRVRADTAEGVRLGVRSTPTFFLGQIEPDGKVTLLRKITGAQPYATFKSALQSALAPAK